MEKTLCLVWVRGYAQALVGMQVENPEAHSICLEKLLWASLILNQDKKIGWALNCCPYTSLPLTLRQSDILDITIVTHEKPFHGLAMFYGEFMKIFSAASAGLTLA